MTTDHNPEGSLGALDGGSGRSTSTCDESGGRAVVHATCPGDACHDDPSFVEHALSAHCSTSHVSRITRLNAFEEITPRYHACECSRSWHSLLRCGMSSFVELHLQSPRSPVKSTNAMDLKFRSITRARRRRALSRRFRPYKSCLACRVGGWLLGGISQSVRAPPLPQRAGQCCTDARGERDFMLKIASCIICAFCAAGLISCSTEICTSSTEINCNTNGDTEINVTNGNSIGNTQGNTHGDPTTTSGSPTTSLGTTGGAVPCLSNSDCEESPDEPVCFFPQGQTEGFCVQCLSDFDCEEFIQDLVCDKDTHECVPPQEE